MIETLFTHRMKRMMALALALVIAFGLLTTGNVFMPTVAASTATEMTQVNVATTGAVAYGSQFYRNLNLTPGGNVNEMHFTWHSQSPTGSVRVYLAGDAVPIGIFNSETPRTLDARSADTSWFPGTTPDYTVHFVVTTGLLPSTDYEYIIVGDSFESLPKPFRTGGDSHFNFLIAGDPQLGIDRQPGPAAYSSWQNTMNVAMAQAPDSAFLLSVGDQIHSNNNTYVNHFARAQYMHDALLSPTAFHSLPFVPVVGNHEAGAINANGPLWHMNYGTLNPIGSGNVLGNVRRLENGPIHFDYYMRWGDMIVIQLDSNIRDSLSSSSARYAWFRSVLEEHNDATWRVVTFHHPPYSAYRPTSNNAKQQIIANWLPALERHNIDIVLSGHCHSYSRSHHMQSNIPVLTQQWLDANGNVHLGTDVTNAVLDPTGITYIAFNSASGSGFYNVTAMSGRYYLATYNQNFMRNFSTVEVTPNTFSVATYQINNDNTTTLVDVYTIVRSDNGAVPTGLTTRQMGNTQWGTFLRANIDPVFAPQGSSLATIEGLLPTQVSVETDLRNNDVGTPETLRPSESGIPDYGPVVRLLSAAVIWDIASITPAFDPNLTTYQTYRIRGAIPSVAGGVVYIDVTVGTPPPPPFNGYISYFGARYHFYGRTNSAFLTDAFDPAIFSNWASGSDHPHGAPTPIGFGTPMSAANAGAGNFSGTLATTIPAGSASHQRGTPGVHTFTYFSRTFNLPEDFCAENIGDVYGAHHIDDNLILFINGIEVYRYNTTTNPANVRIGQAINWAIYVGQNTDARLRSFNINSDFNSRNTGYFGVASHPNIIMYDAASRTNLENALQPGQNVLTAVVGNNTAASSDLWFDLELFMEIEPCECANFSALDLAIDVAHSQNVAVYTAASLQAMQNALTAAITVRNNATATQQEIGDAVASLNTAIAGLISNGYISYFGARYRFYGRSNAAFLEDAFNPAIFSNWVGGGTHPQGAPTPIGFGTPKSAVNAGAGNFSGTLVTTIPAGEGSHLRYGMRNGDLVNHTFTYFSRTFNLPEDFCVDSIGNVYGEHHIDDSLILFINGIEVYRYNTVAQAQLGVPTTDIYVGRPINWNAYVGRNTDARLRSFHINNDFSNRDSGYQLIANFDWTGIDAASRTNLENALRPGQNVLTAVVGNQSATSSDLWFDLQLFIDMEPCECNAVDKAALVAAITNAGTRIEANYTSASWTILQNALTSANAVNSNASATQEQVDAAALTLNNAISGLVAATVVNRDALVFAITNAGVRIEAHYTSASWITLQNALADANAVNSNVDATQAEVDVAALTLNNAITGLVAVTIINRDALVLAIAIAELKVEANYTSASWITLQNALTDANAVNNNVDATQAEVDAAALTLNNAITGLVAVTIINREALVLAIANAGLKVEANYTSASWITLQNALADANAVNSNVDATQEEVDAAALTLNNAIAGLVAVTVVNRDALVLAIANASARTETNYTSASWLVLQNALSNANTANSNTAATQEEVNAAALALNNAIAGLVARPSSVPPSQPIPPSQPTAPSQPNQPQHPPESYEPDDTTYEPVPQPIPTPPPSFVDVNYSDWFYDAVITVVTAGVFAGTGNNEFSPNRNITRAEFVQAIANFTGVNLSEFAGAQSIFTDVQPNMWYSAAVEWATIDDIVTGFGDGSFRPYAPITREQMAVVLFRYLRDTNIELPAVEITSAFIDQGSISYWALEAVLAMQSAGILVGNAAGAFSPHNATTRAEVATLFARLLNLM